MVIRGATNGISRELTSFVYLNWDSLKEKEIHFCQFKINALFTYWIKNKAIS